MTTDPITDVGAMISAAVAAKMTPEFVEAQVVARVEKLITGAVDESLRTYSDTGKLITAAVAEALKVDRLDIPSYGHMVAVMLRTQIEALVAPIVAGQLQADMAELLKLAPKEIKLSQIAEDMLKEHSDDYGPVITVIVERTEHGYFHIYLDDQQVRRHEDRRRCPYHLSIDKEGKIYHGSINERDLKAASHLGRSYGLAQKIRAWHACGTVIILDTDDVVTSVGDY